MGLDRAPIEFWKLVFLVPPNGESLARYTEEKPDGIVPKMDDKGRGHLKEKAT